MEKRLKGFRPELDRILDIRTTGMTPPNRIIFGFGAVEQIGAEAARLVKGKPLKVVVISDKVLKNIGILETVILSLAAAGFTVETFTDVEQEPHIETAEAVFEQCAGHGFSIIVGLGGGSVMDLGKLIAQSAGCGHSPREYFDRKVIPDRPGLPLILVPTTSGTGSEVSPYIITTIGHEKRFLGDPYYYPDMAIVDPLLTVSMPPGVTAMTGIDALSHAVEGMMHKNANPFSDALCLSGIQMTGAYLRRAVADGDDLEARYYMSMSATLSMMGMAMSGPLYAHSVSYVIPMYKSTPHGIGCGLGLPYMMSFNLPVQAVKLTKIAAALGEQTWMYSEVGAAKLAVESVVHLTKDVGLPVTLTDYGGIEKSNLEEMANLMINLYPRPMNPRSMSREESTRFWHNMWEGAL
jgi:alcohol dehydrogenase class IV